MKEKQETQDNNDRCLSLEVNGALQISWKLTKASAQSVSLQKSTLGEMYQLLLSEKISQVSLGIRLDPFSSEQNRFLLSMEVLKILQSNPLPHLIVKTASPLILLAFPLIKSFGGRIHLELNCKRQIVFSDISAAAQRLGIRYQVQPGLA